MNPPETPEPDGGNPMLDGLEADFLAGGGRYTLKRILGKGSSGPVWMALDNQSDEEVALKFLAAAIISDSAAFNDFQQYRVLSHPNIVRIYDLFSEPGEPAFIAMEYVDGTDLGKLRLDQPDQVFTWRDLKPMLDQLCSAIAYAHGDGLVHANIRPSNIFVLRDGRIKLSDFALTFVAPTSLPYASPQRLAGESPTASDDVYSLAATLFELLTGSPPFVTGDLADQIRNVRPQPLSDRLLEAGIRTEVPANLSALLQACLAKDPSERPPAAASILAGMPTQDTESSSRSPSSVDPVEEAAAFERALPLSPGNDETYSDQRPSRPNLANRKILVIVACCLLLVAGGFAWVLRPRHEPPQTQAIVAPIVPLEEPKNEGEVPLPVKPSTTVSNSTYVGEGSGFSYRYAPRVALDLDANAINVGVRFSREGPATAHCSYVMTSGTTNNSVGTITYNFRAAKGYIIDDMRLSQDSTLYTSGRIRGVYSVDGGRTFIDFYLTPPFNKKSFSYARTANLTSLNAPNVLIRYVLHRYAGHDYDLQFLRDCDDGSSFLEITGTVRPQPSSTAEQDIFATPQQSKGLRIVAVGDGPFTIVNKGGITSWAVPKQRTLHYLYFDVDDQFRSTPGGDLRLELEYRDTGSGEIALQYDSTQENLPNKGAFKPHPESVRRHNTFGWQKASWVLSDARFLGSQNDHADFRIYVSGDELLVRKMRITRMGQ